MLCVITYTHVIKICALPNVCHYVTEMVPVQEEDDERMLGEEEGGGKKKRKRKK
jgi:hypothetical protein